jgi:hypothetical protein
MFLGCQTKRDHLAGLWARKGPNRDKVPPVFDQSVSLGTPVFRSRDVDKITPVDIRNEEHLAKSSKEVPSQSDLSTPAESSSLVSSTEAMSSTQRPMTDAEPSFLSNGIPIRNETAIGLCEKAAQRQSNEGLTPNRQIGQCWEPLKIQDIGRL